MGGADKVKILITGSGGFIGRNLIAELKNKGYEDIFLYDIDTDPGLLDSYTKDCEFVFHLAGVNRPKDEEEFMQGNFGFTDILLASLKKNKNTCPILITSSIQAQLDNPYGRSKKAGEDLLFAYGKEMGTSVYVFRLPNVFGKWCRPNYNSVVATFCHNIAHDLPITINDPETVLNLVYIDDVVDSFIKALYGDVLVNDGFCHVPTMHTVKLGTIAHLLESFKESRKNLTVPNMSNTFEKVLYSTYLTYLPEDRFSYQLKMNKDERGSFTEIIRSLDRGQCSVNVSKIGITKGNHWHHTKTEKFLVVSGKASIRFRKIGSDEVLEYVVSSDTLEVVDIPPGYTHDITNIGDEDLVTFMWANEPFDPTRPDTYYERVQYEREQMVYYPTSHFAEKWNISVRTVQAYCKEGRIPGCRRTIGNTWEIPENAIRPVPKKDIPYLIIYYNVLYANLNLNNIEPALFRKFLGLDYGPTARDYLKQMGYIDEHLAPTREGLDIVRAELEKQRNFRIANWVVRKLERFAELAVALGITL